MPTGKDWYIPATGKDYYGKRADGLRDINV